MPLLVVFVDGLGYTLPPDNSSVNERTGHVEEVLFEVFPKHQWFEFVVPHVDKYVVEGLIDSAFVAEHVVNLIDDTKKENPVGEWITLDNGSEDINSLDISTAKALVVEDEGFITIHASLDTQEILVRLIEPEVDGLIVYQVWDRGEVMFVWLFLSIKTFPKSGVVCKRIVLVISIISSITLSCNSRSHEGY